jgi:hypothetical protein
MRIEPEQVLEQHRVPPEGRVEDADLQRPLEGEEQHGDCDDGRTENLDQARRIH